VRDTILQLNQARPGDTGDSVQTLDIRDLTVRFVSKRRQTVALEQVSLSVAAGEFVSIVGPSGCGKSTLLRVAAGLTRPSAGTVSFGGRDVTGPRKDVGFVFQRAALLEWRSVRRNVLLQAEMRGMDKREARASADRLIEMVGLTGFENALPSELSGGMQQRVSLCRALLHRPPLLLMDEPFGALDALTREQMNVELHRIWRETGTTVLFVTHSIPEAVYLGTRVLVMSPRPGRIIDAVDVDLPAERDYVRTLGTPQFAASTERIRGLLGSASHGG
jgi:NitT/TauT family transport system ATP-binding protein